MTKYRELVGIGLFWIAYLTSGSAFAWGNEGHQIVALIAERNLTVAAKSKVDALLALEPGSTLASISTWADEHRSPATASWHYVNLPKGDCHYDAARDCPDGNCAVEAIEKQVANYRSNARPLERLKALKYIVHFVGDIHQPLHAGYAEDKGGNTYQIQAFGRGTNLHALWDTGMLQAIEPDATILARQLGAEPSVSANLVPAQWAEESCQIVGQADFYPPRQLPEKYVDVYGPTLKLRLGMAGLRLAAILNK